MDVMGARLKLEENLQCLREQGQPAELPASPALFGETSLPMRVTHASSKGGCEGENKCFSFSLWV